MTAPGRPAGGAVPPALSPDGWRAAVDPEAVRAGAVFLRTRDAGPPVLFVGYDSGYAEQWLDADPHAVMALANAALPAESPAKITRDDVALLREAAQMVPQAWAGHGVPPGDVGAQYDRLAAKLSALLPPEPVK